MAPNSQPQTRIALPYRIFFLYIEPLFALCGAYFCFFQPEMILRIAPRDAYVPYKTPITPIMDLLLKYIGSLYVLFAINGGIVLRVTKEYNVWRTIVFGMLAADIGHIYGTHLASPGILTRLNAWSDDEWFNNGILVFDVILRLAFLLGIGNKTR